MKKWIVDAERLYCGLLCLNVGEFKAQIAAFHRRLALSQASARAPYAITLYRQKRGEEQQLLYHVPFVQEELAYDSIGNDACRICLGTSNAWTAWPAQYCKFPNLTRSLRAWWKFANCVTFCLSTHINYKVAENDKASDLYSEKHPEAQGIVLRTFSRDRHRVDDARWHELERWAKLTLQGFGKGAAVQTMLEPGATPQSEGVSISEIGGLQIPESVRVEGLNIADGLSRFSDSFEHITQSIGPPQYVEFEVEIENWEPASSHFLHCAQQVPRVWSHFATRWWPVKFDIFSTPSDSAVTRAYPLITVQSTDQSPNLFFQINLVHSGGKSFIECQVYEDRKWFDLIANFFSAPIDIWEGPIESRFGWYGDASLGRLVRHQPDPTQVTALRSSANMAYLVQPKAFFYGSDYWFPAEKQYTQPAGLFRDRESAEACGSKNSRRFMGDNALCIFTSMTEPFLFEALPDKSQTQIRKLMNFRKGDDWRKVFSAFLIETLTERQVEKLFKLLEVQLYEIVEAEIEDQAFFERLARKIRSGKIDQKAREQIIQLFGLHEGEADE